MRTFTAISTLTADKNMFTISYYRANELSFLGSQEENHLKSIFHLPIDLLTGKENSLHLSRRLLAQSSG